MDRTNFDYNLCKSRFILNSDPQVNTLLYPIPSQWWSRLYEYAWASQFVEAEDISLDAACGLPHHFKFYIAEKSKEAYACDITDEIEDKAFMLNLIKNEFSLEASLNITSSLNKLNLIKADISDLPYNDKKFDKIYCISVLPEISAPVIEKTFLEFNRVLKDDGLIILSMDHPRIDFNYLTSVIANSGFKFLSDVDFTPLPNILQSNIYPGITCFRFVLCKNDELMIESAEII
ncbi:class I SAM-dependent methyltransferase [Clostridium sp.]|uniref:class I SAM-dependent methyltransferase n=1 Tax=Clostridium sp. TaxID=1506 RepID=UPI003F2F3CA9